MARDDAMDVRLRAWAQWVSVGDGSGFPTKSVLHPEWSPPSPGQTPTLKTFKASMAPMVDGVIRRLSERQQQTLHVCYCTQMTLAERAERLQCQPATVDQRIWVIHRELQMMLG